MDATKVLMVFIFVVWEICAGLAMVSFLQEMNAVNCIIFCVLEGIPFILISLSLSKK